MKSVAKIIFIMIFFMFISACGGVGSAISDDDSSTSPADPVTDDTPAIEKLTLSNSNANNFGIPENSNSYFIFILSGTATVDTNIDWAIFPEGGGSAAADFTVVTGTIVIPAGDSSVAFALPINDDSDFEGDESYSWRYMSISDHVETSSSEFSFTIIDNEVPPGPPVSFDLAPASFDEDVESVITLNYSDADGDKGTACTLSNITNITESTACSCDGSGVCTVGVTGTAHYNGAASFDYTVTANGDTSVASNAVLAIDIVDDAPIAVALTPASFNEDVESIITLSYSDVESDIATTCTLSSLTNVLESTACSCDGVGVCTVGVTGTSNYNGAASFDYTITANTIESAAVSASFTIDAVDDTPVASDISPASFNEDTESVITLNYADADSDAATVCSVSGLTNISESTACSCTAGTCTVGVTGTTNYFGAASFDYTVTANAQLSNSAVASLTIDSVDDIPVAAAMTPVSFDEDMESVITLSYADADSDAATVCSISGLTNITESTACSCTAGTCTVGVTGTANYFGAASFNFTVTANAQLSNSAAASLTIDSVSDAPVAAAITPSSFDEDVESIITLSYTDAEGDSATSCSVSGLTNISESTACSCTAGTCTVGVTGTASYFGAASFNYTVTANAQTSNSALASLTIDSVDIAPVAIALTPAAFDEDVESIVTLSYTDADGDSATSCSVSGLSNISESTACSCTAGTCTVGVTGTADYNGAAGFNYTVTANTQTSNSAAVTLTIDAVADAPVAAAISPAAFNEDTESVVTLSYADADGDNATACSVSGLSNISESTGCSCTAGTCTVGVTGTAEYSGSAGFNYTVTANSEESNSVAATLTISTVDDAPVASAISPTAFDEDLESIITLSYSDVEGDSATACSVSGLSNVTESTGCICLAGTCTVGVTGTADYSGAASFNYTVTANAQTSNSAAASLTINAVDDIPVAAAISPATFNEDTESVITLSYSDADGDNATACSVSGLSNVSESTGCSCTAGTCTVGVTGTVDYNGVAGFNYTVTANAQTSNSAAASLTINAVDDIPVAAAISPAAFNEDTESVITLSYTDADGDNATACSVSGLSNVSESTGCSCTAGTCTVGITGAAEYSGAASFNYTVTANAQSSNSATATLAIDAVADAPIAAAISPAAFNEDTESVITLSYSDAEGDSATICSVSGLSNISESTGCSCTAGTCTVGVTGTADYNGAAGFNYTVTANAQTSNSAAASLTINAVADIPVAAAISPAAFNEDTESVITLSYTDADGDNATACSVSGLSNVSESTGCSCTAGTCTVGVTGTVDYNGVAGFNYTVTANAQTSNSAAASLTINAVDDIPVAAAISPAAFNEDTESVITLSYTDADGDNATACSVSGLSNISESTGCSCTAGTCTVGVTGAADYNGVAGFNYTVTANAQISNSAAASLTINAVDDIPVAAAISPTAFNEDVESVITLSYSDADGDNATACSVSGLSNVSESTGCSCTAGTCTVGVTGTADYNGVAGFNYTVTANAQTSNSAAASLTVNAVDDVPVADTLTPAAFNEDTASVISLTYFDAETDLATVCTLSNLSGVSETVACDCDGSGDCTVEVTGSSNVTGVASFDYTVTANGQTSAVAGVSFTLNAVNDAPSLAVNTGFTSGIGSTTTITTTELSVTDVDDSDANITYEVEVASTRGAVKLSGTTLIVGETFTQDDVVNDLVTYVHTAGDSTADSFQISVHDDDALYATAATQGSPATIAITVSSCTSGSTVYTADGTFDVDTEASGCTNATIKAWGGGGGGGYLGGSAAGAGGGGGYSETAITISAGEAYTIAVGMGGQGGNCGRAAGAGGFAGGAGGDIDTIGSAGVGDGGDTGGNGGAGVNGPDGGAGGYGGGGGGGGAEDDMYGGAGGGSSTIYKTAVKIAIAGGGGGGGAGEAGPGGSGGAACSINGSDAANSGDAKGGAGGGGGDCVGDTLTSGSGSTEGNSASSGGAGAGGDASGTCTASNGVDGKVIIEYN
jgi:large repetitive protein